MPKVTGKTYISPETVLSAVKKHGLRVENKASFFKVEGEGGRRLYIARTKGVGRVDISGFTMPAGTAGIRDLGELKFGGVSQQLEFEGRTEAEILRTLDACLKSLGSKPARRRATKRAAQHASA